jgi:hypothetical protein
MAKLILSQAKDVALAAENTLRFLLKEQPSGADEIEVRQKLLNAIKDPVAVDKAVTSLISKKEIQRILAPNEKEAGFFAALKTRFFG